MKKTQDNKKQKLRERKPNWQETTASVEDIQQFLSERVLLRFNVITQHVEYHELSDYGKETDEGYQRLSDRVVNTLWTEMAQKQTVRIQDMQRVIDSDFVPSYNPFQYYLQQLERKERWNGAVDHIMLLASTICVKGDSADQELFTECLRRWLVAMVAGWVDDTVVNHAILVLIGPQGAYKTTWFQHLLPPELREYFYTKTNANRMSKDDLLVLAKYGLVCCEELDTMRSAELNQLKAAVTMQTIDERPAYARYHERRPHIASFCGTGNNLQFLSDPTGNRRWLPFEVEYIAPPRTNELDYDGIYAQAYALYKQGYQYWFSQDDARTMSHHNQQFETPRLETELVAQYFRQPNDSEPGEFMSVALALQIVGAGITQKLSAVMLGRAFRELGYMPRTYHNMRGYVVVRRDANEMRSMRQQLANTDTDDTDVF